MQTGGWRWVNSHLLELWWRLVPDCFEEQGCFEGFHGAKSRSLDKFRVTKKAE